MKISMLLLTVKFPTQVGHSPGKFKGGGGGIPKSPNLVTTTPARQLDGLSCNFQDIFLGVSSYASDKSLVCIICYQYLPLTPSLATPLLNPTIFSS